MGRAMFTVVGARAELESAGMAAAKARGRHVGRPAADEEVVARVEELADALFFVMQSRQSNQSKIF